MKAVRNKKVILLLFSAIFIHFLCFCIGFVNRVNPRLSSFSIEGVVEEESYLVLQVTPSHNAVRYKVEGTLENGKVVYETESDSNHIALKDFYNQEKIYFTVTAFNKNNKKLKSENIYTYVSDDLRIASSNEHYVLKGSNVIISILGKMQDDCVLDVYYEDVLLKSLNVKQSFVEIPREVLQDISGRVVLKLRKGERVTSVFSLYVNTPLVGNIKISNLEESNTRDWDDVTLSFQGGENATKLYVNLYANNKFVKQYSALYKVGDIILPASFFEENMEYRLELVAIYEDYLEIAKKDSVELKIGEKAMVSPVYVDYNYQNMKAGTKISLKTNTKDATIYYTLDGTEPTEKSMVYLSPILIDQDVTIKTKAVAPNKYDSVVNIYPVHIGEKQLVVYLSPSNQGMNYGVKEAGYSTERKMMNQLTDFLEDYLKKHGVKVYRNNPNKDINAWLEESNYVHSDFHLAIHSNASDAHLAHGVEMYVDNASSASLSIANQIYNHLYSIYPYQDKSSNRGVKYAEKSLGEANDSFIKCGAVLEIAYHDSYQDAKWMVTNMQEIAENIGESILTYYQIK